MCLPVIDGDGIVVAVESVNKGLDRGFVKMPQVGGRLPRLLAKHERLGVDKAESVNDDLSLDRLDGIDHDGNGTRCKLLERLLGVDIHAREPATKTRM